MTRGGSRGGARRGHPIPVPGETYSAAVAPHFQFLTSGRS